MEKAVFAVLVRLRGRCLEIRVNRTLFALFLLPTALVAVRLSRAAVIVIFIVVTVVFTFFTIMIMMVILLISESGIAAICELLLPLFLILAPDCVPVVLQVVSSNAADHILPCGHQIRTTSTQ